MRGGGRIMGRMGMRERDRVIAGEAIEVAREIELTKVENSKLTVSESLNFNPICKNLSIHANDNEIFLT